VVDGAPAVVRALIAALGDRGTLAMPAARPQCAQPEQGPVQGPEGKGDSVPLFDRQTTPTAMGAIAECFRTWPGALRSDHPLESVCALGPRAAEITLDHPLEFSEGPRTPFGRLHELDSRVLLLGVGFNRCTALHHAETSVPSRRTMISRVSELRDGRRGWVEVANVADDNDTHFPVIGARYLAAARPSQDTIGKAPSVLFPMRELVAFARSYFLEVFSEGP